MGENKKTLIYICAAAVLALLAFIMAPKKITPDAFVEQGEIFFPDFTDPNEATTLEVISFDQNSGQAVPFKVTFENGLWTIPSHYDYPADGKERLAKTATGLIGIKKDDFRTDNISEHEQLGVVDPMDATAPLTGRGQKITIKAGEKILAELIIGNQVAGRKNVRFVRLPDQKRVYSARIDLDLSTKFEDWIETDLLNVMKHKINKVVLKDYSINERTYSVDNRDILNLTLKDDLWSANKMGSGKVVDSAKMNALLSTLDELKIVGVRPKPEGLSASLKLTDQKQNLQRSEIRSLQSKGFYISRDGQLLSNEGEMQFNTSDGVKYTLRFGEVVYGSGLAVSAGGDEASSEGAGQNRYLFITSEFISNYFKEPAKPKNRAFENKPDSLLTETDQKNKELDRKHKDWQRQVENGRKLSNDLNERFADWYYVISSDSFEKLHLKRKDLVVSK